MSDSDKTKEALLEELKALRSRVAELQRIEEEYKQTEAELRERQELCGRAEEIAHFSHWERNLVEDKATWSAESYRIFGVGPNKFQPSYKNFLNLIHPCDRERVKSALEAAPKEGKGFDIEYRIVRPDGAERVLHSVAEVRFDGSGRAVKLVGTAHDVTERRQAEEGLRKAHHELEKRVEERTATLAEANALLEEQIGERKRAEQTLKTKDSAIASAINGVAFVDLEGNLTYVNDSFLEMWGYTAENKALGKPAVGFWVDVGEASEKREIVHKTGSWEGELVARRKDGSAFDVEVSASLVKDENGNPICIMASFIDITERKKAEEQLVESEKWYRLLLEASDAGINLLNKEGTFLILNNRAAEIWGKKPEDLIGKNIRDIDGPPGFVNGCVDRLRRAEKTGVAERQERFIEPLNKYVIEDIRPVKDSEGKFIGVQVMTFDITEHKKAEEALRESEERLRLALSAADMGTWRWDPVTNQDTRDASFNRILGLSAAESTQPVEDFLQRVHPDDRDMVDKEIQCAMRDRGPYLAEFRIVRPDGAIRWLRDQGKVLCDENDRVSYMTGAVVDITDRKKAEEELLFKSTLLQAQSETSIDGILVVDSEGKSISFNKNFGRMWNIPQQILDTRDDEKMLQYVLDQVENPGQFLEKVRYLYTHENEKSRDEIPFKDGRVFDRYSSPLLDSNDKYYGRVWYFRDITEQKKAEEALRESEERHKALFEGAAEGILVAESETKRFKYANPAICEMLGYTGGELARMGLRDIHPKDSLDHVISEFEAQAKREKALAPNIPCLRRDGTIMYADVNTAFMVIDGRQCNVGFFTDITERKKTGEALQRAHDELENRVQERTAELGKAVEELESEICERKTAQKQLRNLAFELAEAEDKLRHRIATNVHDHISQNLALSKIKLESLRALTSLPECVASLDEICELVTQTIESSRSLTSELSPPVLYELGFEAAVEWLVRQTRQPGRVEAEFASDGRPIPLSDLVSRVLFRAVQGLLVNVAKHAQARKVIVSTRRKGNEVRVTVEDDGVGFDASKVISYEHETGGFGLFSIRERLGYIGGRVDIDSKPGHGTRVTLSAHIDQERKNDRRKRK